jgi:uncharacterized membrane protein YphA (DoxX/SURF4 family)
MGKNHCEGAAISLVLRLAVASLFIAAVVPKYMGGFGSVVTNFQEMFKATWLPLPLVTFHAMAVPYIETLIVIWLILGARLQIAWFFTALFLVSLAFGMAVAQQYAVAASNFFYVAVGTLFQPV